MNAVRLTDRRELRAVGLVSALSSGYGVALAVAAGVLAGTGGAAAVGAALVVALTLILFAQYVSGIAISTGVATVVLGIRPHLAQLRMLGARSSFLRRRLVVEVVGVAASAAALSGIVVATAGVLIRARLIHDGTTPAADFSATDALIPVVVVVTIAVAAVASRAASRSVLAVRPSAALAAADSDAVDPQPGPRRVRTAVGVVLVVVGAGALVFAAFGPARGSSLTVLTAFAGGVVVSSGVLLLAPVLMPSVVAALGALCGRSAAAVVARSNAYAHRSRTVRSTVGILIGVTLVITFATGATALKSSFAGQFTAAEYADVEKFIDISLAVVIGLTVFSAVISAVGYVSIISASIEQRRREIGMLRVLGLRRRDVYRTVVFESLATAGAAVALGVVLGVLLGSAGARAVIPIAQGAVYIPWGALAITVVIAAALVIVSSLVPARRAAVVSPIEAVLR